MTTNRPIIDSAAAISGIPIIEAHHPDYDWAFWYRSMSDLEAVVDANLVDPATKVEVIFVDTAEWPYIRAENAARALRGEPLTFGFQQAIDAFSEWDGNR